jgi:hypothetical protein
MDAKTPATRAQIFYEPGQTVYNQVLAGLGGVFQPQYFGVHCLAASGVTVQPYISLGNFADQDKYVTARQTRKLNTQYAFELYALEADPDPETELNLTITVAGTATGDYYICPVFVGRWVAKNQYL